MNIILDANMPDSVKGILLSRGHQVRLVREIFTPGVADRVIAQHANDLGAVVVTFDTKDFIRIFNQIDGDSRKYPNLGLILCRCDPLNIVSRMESCIDSIEYEYQQCRVHHDRRILVEIRDRRFSILR